MFTQSRQKVLAAVPPPALVTLEKALGRDVELTPAHQLDEALRLLRSDRGISLILCGVHFDESRMFDLLRAARAELPSLPFVCCRIFSVELPHVTLQAIEIASRSLGAAAFIDLPALAREHGDDGAERQLRSSVLAHLPPGKKTSGP